jgi:hypothetical protein
MEQIDLMSPDFIGTIISALLTIMVLSYLIGDNVFFRLAVYIFVGVSSGYAGAVAFQTVIRPKLIEPFFTGNFSLNLETIIGLIIPWILSIFLMLNLFQSGQRLGGLPLAFMVGIGAAVVVGGTITGTLLPQIRVATKVFEPALMSASPGEELQRLAEGVMLTVGTISTLFYFRFTARRSLSGEGRRSRLNVWMANLGRLFIVITFGAMYAGALVASVIILAERVQFVSATLSDLIGLFLSG